MRPISTGERRARLAARHHLGAGAVAPDACTVATDLVGLHATDAASVYLSVAARTANETPATIATALYDDRTLLRMLGMRRTVFVVPVGLAPVIHAACTRAIAATERRKLAQLLEAQHVTVDGVAWLDGVERATVAALEARGEATAAELSADVPDLRAQFHFGEGRKWEGSQRASTRVLFLLAADGGIVRGRPRGSWTSTQYRWAPMRSWLPGGIDEMGSEEAEVVLARRWLHCFGPGTVADVKWWTGWTMATARRALAAAGAVEVELDGATGLVLADDVDEVATAAPRAALLPALDPTVMGWADREWYLGPHRSLLFDRSGNAGPTVWWDGRVVGGWAQRRSGELAYRLLEDIGHEGVAAVDGEVDALGRWIGAVRLTPRFRTPMERELTG